MSHTKEPWEVVNGTDIYSVVGVERSSDGLKASGSDGWHIAECGNPNFTLVESGEEFSLAQKEREANARRIVACVNACAGISTEILESPSWKIAMQSSLSMWQSYCEKKMQLEDAIEQRDELLAALQTFVDEHEECTDAADWMAFMCSTEALHVAEEAIASVKGGAA